MERDKFVVINQFRYTHSHPARRCTFEYLYPTHAFLHCTVTITKAEEECALYIVKKSYLNNPPLVFKKSDWL